MGAVELRLRPDLRLLDRQELREVELVAEAAEQAHVAARRERCVPQRLRVRAGRDVRAEARGRIEEAEALLDAQALNGVGIVGAPDLRGEPEHAAVKAVAAGRAALKQDLRPGQEDTAQHVVEAEDEGVLLRAERAGMAVHIPLDVGVVQGPVGVLPVELRVRADGFRLEPEAELQSHGVQLFAEAAQAARQLLFVHGIVAKAGSIAVALAEPAVVEDEQLAAELLCRPAEAQELRFRKIEHAALPAVVDDGAGPALPVRRDEVFVHIPVEAGGQAAEARAGICHDGLRRLKARAGREFPVEIRGRDALQHAGEALHALLRAEIVAAGVAG